MMGLMLHERLRTAQAELDRHQARVVLAQDERRRLIVEATQAGWSMVQLGAVLGVTPQRAGQLMFKAVGNAADRASDG